MKTYHIAVLPGDGIGKEVIPEGVKILSTAGEINGKFVMEFEYFPWGCEYYLENHKMMPEDGLKTLQQFDAIYFGAVGFPTVDDSISLRGLRLKICQSFDQYANIRPSYLLPGIKSPLRNKTTEDINFVVVRENTEGEYVGAGGRTNIGKLSETALQVAVFTRTGTERIIRYAFDLANKQKKHLISVSKSNAQEHAFGLWDDVTQLVSLDYPEVAIERVLVDAMAARMVLRPETLDVVVASNLHADILTDVAGAICGSLGVSPSGNINPERSFPSMFEPIHGSAPDIFGKGIANPIGTIWSGAMMLEHLGEKQAADLIVKAIQSTTSDRVVTPDLGGSATTQEVGEAVKNNLEFLGIS